MLSLADTAAGTQRWATGAPAPLLGKQNEGAVGAAAVSFFRLPWSKQDLGHLGESRQGAQPLSTAGNELGSEAYHRQI